MTLPVLQEAVNISPAHGWVIGAIMTSARNVHSQVHLPHSPPLNYGCQCNTTFFSVWPERSSPLFQILPQMRCLKCWRMCIKLESLDHRIMWVRGLVLEVCAPHTWITCRAGSTRWLGPISSFGFSPVWRDQSTGLSNKLPCDADAAGSGPHLENHHRVISSNPWLFWEVFHKIHIWFFSSHLLNARFSLNLTLS